MQLWQIKTKKVQIWRLTIWKITKLKGRLWTGNTGKKISGKGKLWKGNICKTVLTNIKNNSEYEETNMKRETLENDKFGKEQAGKGQFWTEGELN